MEGPVYIGTISSFNPQKGWGFIESDQTKKLYGQDIFLLKSEVPGGMINKGDQVHFGVRMGDKGVQACNVSVFPRSPAAPSASGPWMQSAPDPEGSATYIGNIMSFNPSKGWGFIQSEQSMQIFGKDIFLLRSEVPGGMINKGTQVSFGVRMGEKGAQACNVQVLSADPGAAAGMGASAGFPGAGFPGAGFQGAAAPGAMIPAGQADEGQRFVGTVISFNREKGWGFIECKESQAIYGKDMFLLRSAIQGGMVEKGEQVSFTVKMGEKGLQAASVYVISQSQPQANYEGESYVGVVTGFDPNKGWGFLSSAKTHRYFGRDVFFLKTCVHGTAIHRGDQVRFAVYVGEKGPQASWVQVLSSQHQFQQGGFQQPMPAGAIPMPALANTPASMTTNFAGVTYHGAVKHFNAEKGWGHIMCSDTHAIFGKDIIFLRDSIKNGEARIAVPPYCPPQGAQVSFGLRIGPKGPEAENVYVLMQDENSQAAGAGGYGPATGEPGDTEAGCGGAIRAAPY